MTAPKQQYLTLIKGKDGKVDYDQTFNNWYRTLNHILPNLDTSSYVSIATGSIDDTMIDWGIGANQVNIGDIPIQVTIKTSSDTLLVSEQGAILASNTITLDLPTAASAANRFFSISNIGTGVVTIDGNGANIQGDSTFDLYDDENLVIVCDGSNWYTY